MTIREFPLFSSSSFLPWIVRLPCLLFCYRLTLDEHILWIHDVANVSRSENTMSTLHYQILCFKSLSHSLLPASCQLVSRCLQPRLITRLTLFPVTPPKRMSHQAIEVSQGNPPPLVAHLGQFPLFPCFCRGCTLALGLGVLCFSPGIAMLRGLSLLLPQILQGCALLLLVFRSH